MKSFFTIFSIAFFSLAVVTATTMAGHKDSHTGGGVSEPAPEEKNVVAGSDGTNSNVAVIGVYNFSYESPADPSIRTGNDENGCPYVDCVGFYCIGGIMTY